MTIVSLIVAAAENNVIGKDNKMPWHIPEDFKHFKEITIGKPCIMGRKTYESILDQLGKPLPGRLSFVISRRNYQHDGCTSFISLNDAITEAKNHYDGEIMIIGGAQIYKQSLDDDLIDRIYLTQVHQSPEGDAFFPKLGSKWIKKSCKNHDGYSFLILERT